MSAATATRQASHPSRRTNQSVSSNASASSSRSERSRPPPNPAVESAVTRLLVSIKVLLESLTQWSKQIVDEVYVSDVYVRLGNDFNSAVAAFGAFGIDMNELASVPDDLREILEACLSEDANPENLEKFLPRVRKIITQLLQGLRAKQSIYRRIVQDHKQRSDGGSDRDSRSSRSERVREEPSQSRPSSRGPNDAPARSKTPSSRRKPSSSENTLPPIPNGSAEQPFVGGFTSPAIANALSADSENVRQRSSTPAQARPSLGQANSFPTPRAYSTSSADPNFPRDPRQQTNGFASPSPEPTLPRPPSVQAPVPGHVKRFSLVDGPVPPPPAVLVNDATPVSPPPAEDISVPGTPSTESTPMEPPPPAVQNSLAALKKAEALERRASKRFSTYNISKMTGMRAGGGGGSTSGGGNRRSLIAANGALTPGDLAALAEEGDNASPRKNRDRNRSQRGRGPSPIVEGEEPPPVPPLPPKSTSPQPGAEAEAPGRSTPQLPESSDAARAAASTPDVRVSPAESVESAADAGNKPFPVFLQVGREVKKVVIEPGMSLTNLRLLFVDKFSYSPGQDNFPAIYIRDPSSGVQYELEDVDEVKEKVMLSLNIEPLDQIKQHIDVQISSLQQDIKDLRTAVVNNRRTSTIIAQPLAESTPIAPRPSEQRFRDVARRISRLIPENTAAPIVGREPSPAPIEPQWTGSTLQMQHTGSTLQPQMTGASEYTTRVVTDLKTQFDEVQNLRRDLGIMRQLYTEFMKQTKDSLGTLRAQTQTVKQLSTQQVGGARAYIDTGKAKLDTRSQNVLTRMEELQDTVEGIKDDVLKRNVSPKAFLLRNVKGDIDAVAGELQSLKDHIQTIKPMWKKTWEEELQNIVEEQQFLQHQEEFLEDLFEDHKAVLEVFGHVEKVISLRGASSTKRRAPTFRPAPAEEAQGGLNNVMLEIRSAAVDPERRLKAIAANEKNREREMATRTDEFQNELNGFVAGKKLRMTGGAEEAERVRKRKDELTLKAMFTGGGGPVGAGPASPLVGSSSGLPSPRATSPGLPAGEGEAGDASAAGETS